MIISARINIAPPMSSLFRGISLSTNKLTRAAKASSVEMTTLPRLVSKFLVAKIKALVMPIDMKRFKVKAPATLQVGNAIMKASFVSQVMSKPPIVAARN